ncbi:uncharacterized protein [Littorina saxatilis]|uniref:Uncharacterized protein n=1 Tax=Littorina saxatilis TaxID=31220 RepID=A0AAN9C2I4_9CAEN
MALLLISLLILGVVGCGMTQNGVVAPAESGCANKTGYVRGSDNCCANFVFAIQFRICCTDDIDGVCYCDGVKFGDVCSANPAPPTPAPVTTLCPGTPPAPMGRMLNSRAVTNACAARGVVGLATAGQPFCNAAFIKHPETGDKELFTLTSCWDSLSAAQAANVPTTGKIFGDEFPLDDCSVTPNNATAANPAVTVLTLSKLTSYFVEQHLEECSSPGCIYTPSTMRDHVNLNNCSIVSYGYTLSGTSELSRVSVKVGDITQCGAGVAGTQCFTSPEGGASCLGDGGAPVYCSLSTGEVALYGIASSPKGCSPLDTSFNVFPIQL